MVSLIAKKMLNFAFKYFNLDFKKFVFQKKLKLLFSDHISCLFMKI